MDEGKKLLSSIIDSKLVKLSELDESELFIDGINIKEFLELIKNDANNFYKVTDNLIDEVVSMSNVKNEETFRLNVRSARDLLIGKKEYNLKVRLTNEHEEAVSTFKKCLERKIKSLNPDIINKEELIKRITELKRQVDSNFLINDFDIIETIVEEYDNLNYDNNMLIIMKYVNDLNINLMKTKKRNAPIFDIQMIRRPKIDPTIKEILKKLDIKTKTIPNFLLSEIKKCDAIEFEKTYKTIKKNKAEHGGILHFIEKDNIVGRLIVLLYASEESVLSIVESTKDENGVVNIPLLKIIVNKIPTALLAKNNAYYKTKYNDYIKNLELLKEIGVNYVTLMKRNPLFMIIDNSVLDYTLDYVSKLGANKKDIVNRCYKTLSIKPSLIIDNIEIMKKHNISLEKFFNSENTNYNLLKMGNLDHKLNFLRQVNNVDVTDIDTLNKLIITKVYRESKTGYINWGQ